MDAQAYAEMYSQMAGKTLKGSKGHGEETTPVRSHSERE